MFGLLLTRTCIMLIYIIIGLVLYKKKLVSDQGAADLGKLLVYIILPSAILNSYNIEYSPERARGLLLSFLLAVLALAVSVVCSRLLFPGQRGLESFSAAFSNAGFMGIPLVSAVIGPDAVYYAAAFVALLNILQWTYGVFIITGNKEAISPKKIITNPVLISFVIGVILFFLPFRVPEVLSSAISGLAALNAPMAMLTIGFYMAQTPLKSIFTDKLSYSVSAVRLLLIPVLTGLLLFLLPLGSAEEKLTVMILAAAPVGANVTVYARLYGGDYVQSVREVVLSTLFSILTMPIVVSLFQIIV